MDFKYDFELDLASKYAWVMSDYVDTHYEFECACAKNIVGRNKSELMENFRNHFKDCPAR